MIKDRPDWLLLFTFHLRFYEIIFRLVKKRKKYFDSVQCPFLPTMNGTFFLSFFLRGDYERHFWLIAPFYALKLLIMIWRGILDIGRKRQYGWIPIFFFFSLKEVYRGMTHPDNHRERRASNVIYGSLSKWITHITRSSQRWWFKSKTSQSCKLKALSPWFRDRDRLKFILSQST